MKHKQAPSDMAFPDELYDNDETLLSNGEGRWIAFAPYLQLEEAYKIKDWHLEPVKDFLKSPGLDPEIFKAVSEVSKKFVDSYGMLIENPAILWTGKEKGTITDGKSSELALMELVLKWSALDANPMNWKGIPSWSMVASPENGTLRVFNFDSKGSIILVDSKGTWLRNRNVWLLSSSTPWLVTPPDGVHLGYVLRDFDAGFASALFAKILGKSPSEIQLKRFLVAALPIILNNPTGSSEDRLSDFRNALMKLTGGKDRNAIINGCIEIFKNLQAKVKADVSKEFSNLSIPSSCIMPTVKAELEDYLWSEDMKLDETVSYNPVNSQYPKGDYLPLKHWLLHLLDYRNIIEHSSTHSLQKYTRTKSLYEGNYEHIARRLCREIVRASVVSKKSHSLLWRKNRNESFQRTVTKIAKQTGLI